MTEIDYPVLILLTGAVVAVAIPVKGVLERTPVPPLVGFLLMGLGLRLADDHWGLLGTGALDVFRYLAKVGVVMLLFRIGLESNLRGLLAQLRRASLVWVADVAISGTLAFWAAYSLLGMTLLTSLVVATAMTATSVGISVAVWERANALDSPDGELLIDVAELDDISAVILMALLFAVLPMIRTEGLDWDLLPVVGRTAGIFLAKLVGFGGLCALFAHFLEEPMTRSFRRICPRPNLMLLVVGIGLIFAALAGMLGFSLAIGAFFAGLVFSRDPESVKLEAAVLPLYALFTPFFFIGIGLDLDPGSLTAAATAGGILLLVAVGAKLVADGLPVAALRGAKAGVLLGVSMVPRAEISMIIMHKGLRLGDWAVTPRAFGAAVVVSAGTCMIVPLVVRSLLERWPRKGEENG